MFAPGVPEAMAEFQSTSLELAAFVVSVYVLGFATGPLVMAPLSELYGRLLVYHFSNLGFIAFTIACALAPSMNALVVFRFFSGVFGSCTVSNGKCPRLPMCSPAAEYPWLPGASDVG